MAIASLILSILSLLLSWIPVLNIIALIPCILSIIFGIVSISKNNSNKAMSITGIITSVIALGVILVMTFLSWIFVSVIDTTFESAKTFFDNNNFHFEYNFENELYSTYSLNEDIKLNDRVINVEKAEKSQGDENYKPKDGNEFIFVTVSMKNISMYDILYNCDNFVLFDEDKNEYESDYSKIKSNTTFTKGSIESGSVFTGILCFEVPKESQNLTLQYENYINRINISLN